MEARKTDCVCKHCRLTFQTPCKLKKHIVQEHTDLFVVQSDQGKQFQCQLCEKLTLFTEKLDLLQHIQKHHRAWQEHKLTRSKKCPNQGCDRTFPTTQSVKVHVRTFHKGIYLKCKFCNKRKGWKGNLKQHHLSKHPGIPWTEDCIEEVQIDAPEVRLKQLQTPIPRNKLLLPTKPEVKKQETDDQPEVVAIIPSPITATDQEAEITKIDKEPPKPNSSPTHFCSRCNQNLSSSFEFDVHMTLHHGTNSIKH